MLVSGSVDGCTSAPEASFDRPQTVETSDLFTRKLPQKKSHNARGPIDMEKASAKHKSQILSHKP